MRYDQLVDDQPILILERRRHALALDARHLEAERDDEDGVDGRRHQRLHPGDELFLDLRQADARSSSRRSVGVRRRRRQPRRRRRLAGACGSAGSTGRRRCVADGSVGGASVTASGTPAAAASASG